MGNEGRPIKDGVPLAVPEVGVADLLDPVALEERLREARARRAAALSNRTPAPLPPQRPAFARPLPSAVAVAQPSLKSSPDDVPAVQVDRTAGVATGQAPVGPLPPATLATSGAVPLRLPEATAAPLQRFVRVPVWAIFVTGLALGGAVVALLAIAPSFRQPDDQASTAPPTEIVTAAATAEPPADPAPAIDPVPDAPAAAATVPPPPDPAPTMATPLDEALPSGLAAPTADPAAVPPPVLETAHLSPAAPEPEAPAAPPAAVPLPARVTIHYPPSAATAAENAAAALRAAGLATVATIPVRFDISRTNVRFYHAGDGGAADTVAGLLATDGEPPLTRDFTDYRTPAAAGTVEVWLAGTATAALRPRPAPVTKGTGTRTAPATRSATATPPDPEPTPLPTAGMVFDPSPSATSPAPARPDPAAPADPQNEDQAQAVARIIVQRAYERLMGTAPGE